MFTVKNNCPSTKIRHESEEDARIAARKGMLRNSPKLYVYSCVLCMGWHLTSSPPLAPVRKRKK